MSLDLEKLLNEIDKKLGTKYTNVLNEYIDNKKGAIEMYGTGYFAGYFVTAVMNLQKLYDISDTIKDMISNEEYRLFRIWLDMEKADMVNLVKYCREW